MFKPSGSSTSDSSSSSSSSISTPPALSPSHTPRMKVLVVGGNGYIGSHVLKELIMRKRAGAPLHITSLSRSGKPAADSEDWSSEVEWNSGDCLSDPSSVGESMKGSRAVISCVGGFGNVKEMERINGTTNAKLMTLAKGQQVPRFVYISAHHYALPQMLKQGYYNGKFEAEKTLVNQYGTSGVQIRPSFVYGTRQFHNLHLPLWLIGKPLQFVTTFKLVRSLTHIPVLGPVLALPLTPPVSVEAVARAAVDAALNETVEKNIVDIDDILKLEK